MMDHIPACQVAGGGIAPCVSAVWNIVVTAIGAAVVAVLAWVGLQYIQPMGADGMLIPPALALFYLVLSLAAVVFAIAAGIRGIRRRIRHSRAEHRLMILDELGSIAASTGLRVYDMAGFSVEVWADPPGRSRRVFWSTSPEAVRHFLSGWYEAKCQLAWEESRRLAEDNGDLITVNLLIKRPWAFNLYHFFWKFFHPKKK
ncbi:hypothetical protein L6255_02660 [Candidatus Parcubacteria bacterium]|nr:hypothetical protein [Patescibacteria group bacterium]MCG2689318.1 hypothetical protein [Candidatus Parcubacteria bacterium]